MASLSSNPSSVVSAGTWTGGANVYASDNVYATNTGSVQNTEYPLDVGGFNFAAIPAGSTINSVTVTIEAKTGTAARAQIKGELYDSTTLLTGTLALTNLTAADANYTFTPTATLAQLKSANLKVRVTNKRTVSQASTTSVDWVKIDVDYTAVPDLTQAAYRFYEDGTETGAVALAAQDTAPIVDTSAGDANLGLRVRLQSTSATAVPATDDFRLQWEKNTSGTWTNVTTGGTTAAAYASPNLTDAAATTSRLTGGTGTFTAGKVSGDGLVDDLGWSGNNHTELLYSLTLKQADLTNGDALAFRVLRNSAALPALTALAANNEATRTSSGALHSTIPARGQSFLGTGGNLTTVSANLTTVGTPNGIVTAALYAHSGTYGSAAVPTGSPLATSTTTYPSTSVGGIVWFDFNFDGTYTLVNGTPYFIVFSTTNSLTTLDSPSVSSSASGSHAGNAAQFNGTTWTAIGIEYQFRVYAATSAYTQVPSVTIGAGGPATIQATVALTAAATLTTAALVEEFAAVDLTATSTLTVAATVTGAPVTVDAAAALTGTSTLTATAFEQAQGSVSLFAASTLTTTAVRFGVLQATVPLTATATLTTTAVRQPQASVSLVAGSSLTVAAVRSAEATASLSAASTLTASATTTAAPVITAAVALTGVSALSVSATVTAAPVITATVAMSATATLTAAAVREPQAAVSLVSASTLNATAERVRPAVVSLSATSTLSATGVPVRAAAVPLAAASTLTVTGVRASVATVALTASSTLTAAAVREPQAAVSLTATSTLTATGFRTSYPTVGLVAASTLTVAAVPVRPAAVPLTATSTLTVTAIAIGASAGVAVLVATSTLTTAATRTTYGTVSLTATALLTVQGVRVRPIAVSLSATSTLTATPTRIRPAVVPLTGVATLTVTAVRSAGTAVGMVATATLVATATTDSLAAVLRDVARTGYLHALDTDMNWYPVTTAP